MKKKMELMKMNDEFDEKRLTPEMKEAYEKLRENKNPTLIYRENVPKPTRELFYKLAHKQFNGNYGFALKHLIDFYSGCLSAINPDLEAQILLINGRLDILEKAYLGSKETKVPEKKEIKRQADGTVLKGDENEAN